LALNIVYQVDVAQIPIEEAIQTAREHVSVEPEVFEFAELLAKGTYDNREEIDANIQRLSIDWPLDRQPAVDRNILRLAIFEIDHIKNTPYIVVVNEAVEIAKKYSTSDSGKFVNGVLAGYLREKGYQREGSNQLDSSNT